MFKQSPKEITAYYLIVLAALFSCGEEEEKPVAAAAVVADACQQQQQDQQQDQQIALQSDATDDDQDEDECQQQVQQVQQQQTAQTTTTTPSTTSSTTTTAEVTSPTLSITGQTNPDNEYYIEIEQGIGTVSFTHTGTGVQCSRDNGSNWEECDSSTSFSWNASDYNSTHLIRPQNGSTLGTAQSFVPSEISPSLSIYQCDDVVYESEFFDDFNARISAVNLTICLDDGVTIYNDDTIMDDVVRVGYNGVTIIAGEDSGAYIVNERTDGDAFNAMAITSTFGVDNVSIIGVDLSTQSSDVIYVYGGDAWEVRNLTIIANDSTTWGTFTTQSSTSNLIVENVTIIANNNHGFNVGGHITKINDVNINCTGTSNSNGITLSGVIDLISNVTFDVVSTGISASAGSSAWGFTLSDSAIIHRGTGNFDKGFSLNFTGDGGTALIEDSIVYMMDGQSSFGGPIYAVGGDAGTLTLNSNIFVRLDSGDTSSWAIRLHSTASNADLVFSDNNNLFCAENTGNYTFSSVLDISTGDAQNNFDPSNELNGGVVGQCDPAIIPVL